MLRYYIYTAQENTIGPMDEAGVKNFIASSSFTYQEHICIDGDNIWYPIAEIFPDDVIHVTLRTEEELVKKKNDAADGFNILGEIAAQTLGIGASVNYTGQLSKKYEEMTNQVTRVTTCRVTAGFIGTFCTITMTSIIMYEYSAWAIIILLLIPLCYYLGIIGTICFYGSIVLGAITKDEYHINSTGFFYLWGLFIIFLTIIGVAIARKFMPLNYCDSVLLDSVNERDTLMTELCLKHEASAEGIHKALEIVTSPQIYYILKRYADKKRH